MEKLSNTEAELQKEVAYDKSMSLKQKLQALHSNVNAKSACSKLFSFIFMLLKCKINVLS